MRPRLFLLYVLASVFLCAGMYSRTDAGLIADGGFETPVIPSGTYQDFAGGSNLGAWTVLGNDVLLIQTDYAEPSHSVYQFNAEEGENSVDLTGFANSGPTDGVQQVVTTIPNQAYQLSFWVGTASGDAYYSTPATDDLSINGGAIIPFTNSNFTAGQVNWQEFTYEFTATGSATTIAFLNGTPANTSFAGLDNVSLASVANVPEPSTLTLFVTGIAIAAWRRRRRAAA